LSTSRSPLPGVAPVAHSATLTGVTGAGLSAPRQPGRHLRGWRE
jgi:hypothetical protein